MKYKTHIIVLCVIVIVGVVFALRINGRVPLDTTTESRSLYMIQSDAQGKAYVIHTPNTYTFSIVDERGSVLKDFSLTHTKLMHVIVARKDLAYFQHVHPEFDAGAGVFTLKDLVFPADGVYRIFADFVPGDTHKDAQGASVPVTLSEDVLVGVGTHYIPQPIGSEEKTKIFNGYRITLLSDNPIVSGKETMLSFEIQDKGIPVIDLEPYLGALGHTVVLRENTLQFIHAHPMEHGEGSRASTVDFMVDFPESGTYKVFTQFQRAGKIITSDFVVSVIKGQLKEGHSMH